MRATDGRSISIAFCNGRERISQFNQIVARQPLRTGANFQQM
jgi:hypothetical protein